MLIGGVLALIVTVGAPTSAQAKTVKCSGDKYLLIDRTDSTRISNLSATNLPARTTGYAPRCLVVAAAASLVQSKNRPKYVTPMGARWTARRYLCKYRAINAGQPAAYTRAVCSRGTKRIGMRLT